MGWRRAQVMSSYEEPQTQVAMALAVHTSHNTQCCPAKAWYNRDVAAAIQQQEEASRAHRHTCRGSDSAAINHVWEIFLPCKSEAPALAQQ